MRWWLSIGFVLVWASAETQEKFVATLDTNILWIGEQTKVNLEVEVGASDTVFWPLVGDTIINEVEVLSRGSIDTAYLGTNLETKVYRQSYLITSFDSGLHVLPPFVAGINENIIKSNALLLSVLSVPLDTAMAIRDIKQPMEVDYTFWDWVKVNWDKIVFGLLLILLIGVIAYLLVKRRKEIEQIIPEKPKIPAHILALKRLEELKEQKLWQAGEVKQYYSELTNIVRYYIELRYEIPALERTTDEILVAFDSSLLSKNELVQLKELLDLADMAKFAKARPLGSENEEAYDKAVHFIEATKEVATNAE